MNKFVSASLAALMAVTTLIPATSTDAEARRGRNLAIGAGVVLGAAALAAAASRSEARDYRYSRSSGFARTCRKWYYQCDRGNDYACEKYETRGCTY